MNWDEKLKPLKQSKAFKHLIEEVETLYQTRTVYPPKKALFRALALTPYQSVKLVILGQDPYHQANQANGLAFSVEKGVHIPPSLKNIFKELSSDLNISPPTHGDLTAWAKQGVLLLNTILSVEDSQPGAHQALGWHMVSEAIIKALNEHPQPCVFFLWGKHAQQKETWINTDKHLVIKSSHPSPLSAHRSFFGSKPFSKTNAFLKKHGRAPIDFNIPND